MKEHNSQSPLEPSAGGEAAICNEEAGGTEGSASGLMAETPRRTAVRRLLLERLDDAGMVRPKGMTADAFQQLRRRLVDHLEYLADPSLVTLADLVIRLGAGPLRNVWPAEATVRNLASSLQEPPPERWPIVNSWLASREGPIAREGGYLTELYVWLCRLPVPRPPNRVIDLPKIQEQASDNRRTRERYRRHALEGRASDAERNWLEGYARAEARALEIVAAGDTRRQAKGDAA